MLEIRGAGPVMGMRLCLHDAGLAIADWSERMRKIAGTQPKVRGVSGRPQCSAI